MFVQKDPPIAFFIYFSYQKFLNVTYGSINWSVLFVGPFLIRNENISETVFPKTYNVPFLKLSTYQVDNVVRCWTDFRNWKLALFAFFQS